MIIWLASYPKSGNTWVRSIVSALLYSHDGEFNMNLLSQIPQFPRKSQFTGICKNFNDIEEIKKYWIAAQEKINADKKLYFYKTHNANIKIDNYPFTNKKNTIGTIYIVRDPRNILNSLTNHFNFSQEEAKNFILTKRALKENTLRNDGVLTLVGTWEEHYESWTSFNDNLLIIKYEDLIKDIEHQILKMSEFISRFTKVEINKNKIKKIIETTSFKNLKKMENVGLFKEYKENKRNFSFFHKGPNNRWEESLNLQIKKEIEEKYSILMKKLNYL